MDAPEPTTIPVQIIGSYNVFETDCTCEAFKVGDHNILESKGNNIVIRKLFVSKIFYKKFHFYLQHMLAVRLN